ncbi:DUF3188 domain-containing protein [Acaricomes phytoseiuli]|uniref:DUF3188 domain-containing protein n=1 Tax=Acaricomes phytoseiuli TaxID=291968 RepID=UPI0022239D96|nr:DUF3188 domain-containing protein [Acaricomes phytoseiuli]MCW1249731.1 DUF3188 domain-containing protein [Acaricomes phytoseiuli]
MSEYWRVASPAYKTIVFTAMALLGLGIVLTILSAVTGNNGQVWPSMPFLIAGAVLHLVGLVVRMLDVRRRLRGLEKS